jgi:hypothetical protein
MLFRQLWRWLVWAGLLYGISRIPLTLRPTHPDRCGGIRFLVLPSSAFSIYLAALSVMFSSNWATQLANGGVKLKHFVPEAITFVVASLIAALGPLLVFIPQLFQAKREALAQYGRLAMDYVYRFHQRWIGMKTDDLLGTSDIQSLADLGNAYRVIEESRILIPSGKTRSGRSRSWRSRCCRCSSSRSPSSSSCAGSRRRSSLSRSDEASVDRGRPHDAAEAEVAGRRVDGLAHARGGR